MTDIVERLKARARDLRCLAEARFFALGENPYSEGRAEDAKNADDAADEIERLRAYSASQGRLLQSGVVIPNEEYAALCAERDRLREAQAAIHALSQRPQGGWLPGEHFQALNKIAALAAPKGTGHE
jgi:hypothetical protein